MQTELPAMIAMSEKITSLIIVKAKQVIYLTVIQLFRDISTIYL